MRETIPHDFALRLQLAAIVGSEPASSFVELRPLTPDSRPAPAERAFLPVGEIKEIASRVKALASRFNVYVGAAPRVRPSGKKADVERVHCLWADLDGREALERLRCFDPLPSIVIRTGSPDSAHAYWALREPVTPVFAELANKRLQLALRADPAATDASRILRPAGSLNFKHTPPREVYCTRLETDVFTLQDVVAELPDAQPASPPRPVFIARITGDPGRTLEGILRTLEAKQEGERNHGLNWAAFRIGEHIARGELGEASAVGELRRVALQIGLSEFEIDSTVASGLSAGRLAA